MISYVKTFGGIQETNWNTSKHTEKHRSIMRETQECLVGGLFLWDNTGQVGELMGLHIHNVLYTHIHTQLHDLFRNFLTWAAEYLNCLENLDCLETKYHTFCWLSSSLTEELGLFIPPQLMLWAELCSIHFRFSNLKVLFQGKEVEICFLTAPI